MSSFPASRPPATSSLCIRGWNSASCWSHPDRLTVPLVRRAAGPVPVTGPEAIEEIAGRLERAAAPPLFAVGPSLSNEDAFAVCRLARRLGARVSLTDLTGAPVARQALQDALGRRYGFSDPDAIAAADLVWVFGSDPADCPQVASRIVEATRRGARVVRFDVYAAAGGGSAVVTVLPAGFGATALGLLHAVLDSGLAAADVREAVGFDELSGRRAAALAAGEPAAAAADLALAREFRSASRPVVVIGARWFAARSAEDDTTVLLQALALLGAGDRVIAAVGEANSWGVLDVLGAEAAVPFEEACRAGDLDTLFVLGDDVIRRSQRPDAMLASLSGLRTIVVVDRFPTDTAQIAHVVLPSCGFGEVDGSLTSVFGQVQRWGRVVAAPGDCEPERTWLSRVAARVCQARDPSTARDWFQALQEEVEGYREIPVSALYGENGEIPPNGTKLRLRPVPPGGPSGAKLRPRLERAGGPSGAKLRLRPEEPPNDAADTAAKFPLALVIGSAAANFSTGIATQRDEILRREVIESSVAASPSTLAAAGVKAGWVVKMVEPGGGEAMATARADDRVPCGVVMLVPLAGSRAAALRGCTRVRLERP